MFILPPHNIVLFVCLKTLVLLRNFIMMQQQLELVPSRKDPEQKKSWGFIPIASTCTKVWVLPADPRLLPCVWVIGHLAGATGPCPFVMPRVSSPWPLASSSHHPELNLQFPLYLHTELPGPNVFLNNLWIFQILEKTITSHKNLSLFLSFVSG